MSTEYYIEVHRNCDDKILAKFIANQLKTIMDSEFSKVINCDGRLANNLIFKMSDLELVIKLSRKTIDESYEKIFTNKALLLCAEKEVAREDLKDEIEYLKESINEILDVIESASIVEGMIYEVVEDDILINSSDDDFDIAYKYNGADLPKETHSYGDGKSYECDVTIWCNDVYCKIIEC